MFEVFCFKVQVFGLVLVFMRLNFNIKVIVSKREESDLNSLELLVSRSGTYLQKGQSRC